MHDPDIRVGGSNLLPIDWVEILAVGRDFSQCTIQYETSKAVLKAGNIPLSNVFWTLDIILST